jgi:hypothetical protein
MFADDWACSDHEIEKMGKLDTLVIYVAGD